MAARPKGVAGSRDSLPAQQAAADPLQTYCPDLDQWPRSWAYEERDIPAGLRIVECFKPFLRELLSSQLSRQTLRRHRDNIWALGGEIISRLQMDSDLRSRPIEHGVLCRWRRDCASKRRASPDRLFFGLPNMPRC